YISMAIKNLIDNALKYKTKDKVEIVVDSRQVVVKNYGEKLTKDLEYCMGTFTQEDNTRNIKGYGLGLNIVKRVLDHHHFTLEYSYENNQNIFTLIFKTSLIDLS
ncbi:MAG: ATP-binding protein, partial [Arcobacteraceae bacterium]